MIYAYVRVSTDKQDTDNQRMGIEEKAASLGVDVNKWFTDDNVSGAKEPEERILGELLKTLKSGDIIIASEISRLGRKLFMVMRILEHCMKVGAKVITVKDGYELGDNIQSKVMAFAFGLSAEIERQMIQLRTKEGLAVKKSQGVLLGNSRTKNVNPSTPDSTIKKMVELFEKGLSISVIAKKLTVHRDTVSFYLSKLGRYKGQLKGFKLHRSSGDSIEVNHESASSFGLNYGCIKKDFMDGVNRLQVIGIEKIEPMYGVERQFKERIFFKKSSHEKIDRDKVLQLVLDCKTIPEIHKQLANQLDYIDVYDFVAGDTELSMLYRERGHKRVKKQK